MKHAAMLALSAALGLAAPGLAPACERPTAPPGIDGGAATLQQMLAAKSAVADFMAASDSFQDCVNNDVKAQKAAAAAAKTQMDPAVLKSANEQVGANQADKERVGAAFNAAVKAYKAAHPSG